MKSPGSVQLGHALSDALQLDFPAQVDVFTTCWSLHFSHTEAGQPLLAVLNCSSDWFWSEA